MKLRRSVLVLALAGLAGAVVAADDRAQIAAERRAVNDRYGAEEKACQQRFAVSSCLSDVRQRRRAALAPLRERELQLEDIDRKKRAADRLAAVAAKRDAAAQRAPAPPVEARSRGPMAPARGASSPRPLVPPRAVPTPPVDKPNDTAAAAAERAAEAAARVQQAERSRTQAQAAQARIAQRQASRAATGKPAAPLPVPEMASAPRR